MPADAPARRTVTITGRPVDRMHPTREALSRARAHDPGRAASTNRRRRRRQSQVGKRPDHVAGWAVLMAVLLLLVAATSSHAAALGHPALPAGASPVPVTIPAVTTPAAPPRS